MSRITVIPQTRNLFSAAPITSGNKRRVAGYARVSTDSDEQFTSYEAQVDYYTKYIKSNPAWEFAGVYTDEGISGTNTKHRDGFRQMVSDALEGKIDLIVTKSVSRFARNTVDSLSTIRKLKDKGVEVYFEKESIWTFDSKGELLLTIMSSLAQEESRSISENVTWSVRKRFADGKIMVPYSALLGYDKGPDGNLVINPEEAKIVVLIYKLFIDGKSTCGIAKQLTEMGIPTPRKGSKWSITTINSILTNEKYKGDALLQKSFTVDFLSKKKKTNNGEVPQYYIEGNHEAIITPEEFDFVQTEIERRKKFGFSHSTINAFASKIVCADCGGFYGQKVWSSNSSKYRKLVWQCNGKYKGDHKCMTPAIAGEKIKQKFIEAYQQLDSCREQVVADVREVIAMLTDTSTIDGQIADCEREMQELSALVQAAIQKNATHANRQEEFDAQYVELRKRYAEVEAASTEFKRQRDEQLRRQKRIAFFLKEFESKESPDQWDEQLWKRMVDSAVIHPDGSMDFRFINGQTIRIDH